MSCAPSQEQSDEVRTSAPNFDGLAHFYRWMEIFTFGPYLARCRSAFLGDLSGCRHALVLGGGDGRFTAELLRVNSMIEVDTVDASPAMLSALLRRASQHAGRVRTHCGDVRTLLPPNPPYDLVVTHFFLDCLTTEEVRSLAVTLRNSLSASAVWVISEFAVPEGWFGRLVAPPLIGLLYRIFGFLTGLSVRSLPDYAAALRESGFKLNCRRTFLHGLLASEVWL
jgi:SAM-dependent methyltransferase